jgi:hypothetical protein
MDCPTLTNPAYLGSMTNPYACRKRFGFCDQGFSVHNLLLKYSDFGYDTIKELVSHN